MKLMLRNTVGHPVTSPRFDPELIICAPSVGGVTFVTVQNSNEDHSCVCVNTFILYG